MHILLFLQLTDLRKHAALSAWLGLLCWLPRAGKASYTKRIGFACTQFFKVFIQSETNAATPIRVNQQQKSDGAQQRPIQAL